VTTDFGSEPSRRARKSRVRAEALLAAGIDPGASRAPWGLTLLECKGRMCEPLLLTSHVNPYRILRETPPSPVGVDAPLSPPYRGFRDCERAALRLGARLLPGGTRGMQLLSRTGYSLKMLFYEAGAHVYETHPTSLALLTGAPLKPPQGCCSIHEWHSLLAAVAAAAAWRGEAFAVEGEECRIIVGLKEGVEYKISVGGALLSLRGGGLPATS